MTLDDLIALNNEIAALVRSGVPLEAGLAALGKDLPGRLGRFSADLAERTARGESLAQAIQASVGEMPPAYCSRRRGRRPRGPVAGGPGSCGRVARRLSETYRITAIAAIYPLALILVAWFGAVFFVCKIAPSFATTFLAFHVPGQQFFFALSRAGQSVWFWGPIVPVAVLLLMVASWQGSSRLSLGRTAFRLGAVDAANAPLLAHGDVPRTARPAYRKSDAAAGGGGLGGRGVRRPGDNAFRPANGRRSARRWTSPPEAIRRFRR